MIITNRPVYTLVYEIQTLTTAVYDQFGEPHNEDYEKESLTKFEAMSLVRAERNKRLVDSDWTQLPDTNLSPVKKSEWAAYRQALRDITNNFQWNVTRWPEMP